MRTSATIPRSAVQLLSLLGHGLLDLVYPSRCSGCEGRTDLHHGPLCPRCLRSLERVAPELIDDLLASLIAPPGLLDAAFALWLFDKGGALQRVQHALKYGNRPAYGPPLGRHLGLALQAHSPLPASPDAVVPIPLHQARRYERGYNQSEVLAYGVAEALQLPLHPEALARGRATRSQTRLNRQARWKNVAGSFLVDQPEAIARCHVLLIDDVLTTGATAAAAALALKEAQAASVTLATLALAR